jgi:hypothetical protein
MSETVHINDDGEPQELEAEELAKPDELEDDGPGDDDESEDGEQWRHELTDVRTIVQELAQQTAKNTECLNKMSEQQSEAIRLLEEQQRAPAISPPEPTPQPPSPEPAKPSESESERLARLESERKQSEPEPKPAPAPAQVVRKRRAI